MGFKFYAIKITFICIIIFIFQQLISGFTDFFVLNNLSFIEPWRFVSAIFLHADLTHLLYNMFALALFGSILESMIGEKRFVIVFFGSGILANIISVNFYSSSLGASGAIYGIIGALVFIRPFLVVWAFGLPLPMIVAGIIWVAGDIIGMFIPSNVGHIAHLSGVIIGLILGAIFKKEYLKRNVKSKSIIIELDENEMRRWEDNYLR